jgi:hypothetical protein
MNLKFYTFLFLFSFTLKQCFATGELQPAGATTHALNNYSTRFQDVLGAQFQPASLAQFHKFNVGIYSEKRFLLTQTNFVQLGASCPLGKGAIGVGVQHLGNKQLQEQNIQLGYGMPLSPKISIGAAVHVLRTNALNYGSNSAFTFSVGMVTHLNAQLNIGVFAFNPLQQKISHTLYSENISSKFGFGLGYQPSKKLSLALEVNKDIDYKAQLKMGMDYRVLDKVALRAGFSTQPNLTYFGVGFNLKNIQINLNASLHPQLGVSPGTSFIYQPISIQ